MLCLRKKLPIFAEGYLVTQSLKDDELADMPEIDGVIDNNSNENSNTGNTIVNGGNANTKPHKENVNVVIDDNKVPTVQKADANTNTGDANNMPMWITIAIVSLLGIIAVGVTIAVRSKGRHHHRRQGLFRRYGLAASQHS